jgi:multidrug efflux pump subunit AcrA (membrane-fusion protein)
VEAGGPGHGGIHTGAGDAPLGALGGSALAYLLGGPAGRAPAPLTTPAAPDPTLAAAAPPPAEDGLEVKGKTRPAPGRQALIAPAVLHPVTEVKSRAPGSSRKVVDRCAACSSWNACSLCIPLS